MQITELDKFQITKAINFNNDLNPQLFVNEVMRPEVHRTLMGIADHFREFLGVELTSLVDITLSGSNAAYSYTPHSDIDLHLIVDFSKLPDNEVYRELFDAKKYQYNDQHDIKIKGYEVELYVQDAGHPHVSLGTYSIFNNEWNRFPTKQRANVDEEASFFKYNKLKQLAIRALASDDKQYLNDVLDIIKRYRKAGLSQNGEFGPENLAFKMIRTDGYFDKLWAKRREYEDDVLSLEGQDVDDEEPTDLEDELSAEFRSFGQPGKRTAEDVIKELYGSNEALFDDCDYDTVHECASSIATMEAAYSGNLGAMEVMKFYQQADPGLLDEFRNLLALRKHKEAWEMIQRFTGVELVGNEYHEDEMMLDEDRSQHVADQLNDKLIMRYEMETGDTSSEITAIQIIDKLAVASKKAIQWLANRYIAGEFKLEDVLQIKQELMKFTKAKPKLPPELRDLNRLSLTDLYDITDQIDPEAVSNKEADRKQKQKFIDTKQAEILYKDSNLVILIPKTEEASCFFGKGTKWCTASSFGGDNYFNQYNQQGPLYIIMTKSLGKFQFQFESESFMDARDQELNSADLLKLINKYPKIKEVLDEPAKKHNYLPLMDNPSEEDTYNAVSEKPWNLRYIDNPSIKYQETVLRNGGLHNIKYIKNPAPEIQMKALHMAYKNTVDDGVPHTVEFTFNNINNPTDEAKIFAFAKAPDTLRDYEDIDKDILEKVLKIGVGLNKITRSNIDFIPKGQATFDIVDTDSGEVYTRWSDRGVNEGIEWTQDDDHDMTNPMPVIDSVTVFELMDEVDGELAEQLPPSNKHNAREYGIAMQKIRHKVGTIQEVPLNKIISTEKYLSKDHINALLKGEVKSSSDIPVLYKQGENYFPGDGNHRIVADYISKKTTTRALVLNADIILTEGVGIIVKGVNTTADVDENSTKREAAKLGFTVNKGGIPPLLKANGNSTVVTNIMEDKLTELNMSPGSLQKQVTSLLVSAAPIVGLEFEIAVRQDEETNPKVTEHTDLRDLQEWFENGDEDEVWVHLDQAHLEWAGEKESEWTDDQLDSSFNTPSDEATMKEEFMIDDLVTSGDMDEIIELIYNRIKDEGGEFDENLEITKEIADLTIRKAHEVYKELGSADEWPAPQQGTNPYVRLYYEIFVEERTDTKSEFTDLSEMLAQTFWDSEYPNESEYSLGSWLLTSQIQSFKEIGREFEGLYSEFGFDQGDYTNGSFSMDAAHNMASALQDVVDGEVRVRDENDVVNDFNDYSTWSIEPDGSIKPDGDDDVGMEIVSPALPYEQAIEEFKDVMDVITSNGGYANNSTGLHINVSMKNINHMQLDYAKLVLLAGDKHILRQFGREVNLEYTQSAITLLGELLDVKQGTQRQQENKVRQVPKVLNDMRHDISDTIRKNFSDVHFGKTVSVGFRDDRIEFRSPGGSDYLNSFNNILHVINRFIVAYTVAADPKAHRKEYASKLYKLAMNSPTGKHERTIKEAGTLFAAFNAGLMSKAELVANIEKIRSKRKEADDKEHIDTGKPGEIPNPRNEREAIQILADKHGLNEMHTEMRWQEGMQKEMEVRGHLQAAAKAVFKNLYDDIVYYRRQE